MISIERQVADLSKHARTMAIRGVRLVESEIALLATCRSLISAGAAISERRQRAISDMWDMVFIHGRRPQADD